MNHCWSRWNRWILPICLVFGMLGWGPVHAAPAAPSAVAEEEFTVTLGEGWVSRAKLTYPAGQDGPFPTVLLIANPDVTMDFLVPPIINDPIYKDLAEYLSARGIAVVRYNPRYVNGPGEYADQEQVFAQTPPDMLADARLVLSAIQANPRVDGRRVFVFGWSFSSLAATALAVQVPELAGLILAGPISTTDRQIYIEDYTEVVLPYLLTFAPDGRITPEAIKRAQAGDGGLLAIGLTGFAFTDPNVTDRVAVNPFFDKDGDGVLDLNAEILPNLGAWVDTDPFVASARMLPNVYDQAASLRQPVLILQGENDGSTRVRNTRGLNNAFAGHPDYTLRVYAGLGHSLAPVRGVSYDKFTFYSEQPKADFAAWVLARGVATAAQPVALPSTGASDRSVGWLIGTALLLLLCGAVARRRLAGR